MNVEVELYFDQDQVLVNFEKGCQEVMGSKFPKGRLSEELFLKYRDELYSAIERKGNFWESLEKLEMADELFNVALRYGIKPHILTGFPRHYKKGSDIQLETARQKELSIRTLFPDFEISSFNCVEAHLKQEFVKPDNKIYILVDDLASNIFRWQQAKNAIGIIHHTPALGVRQLESILDRLL